MNKFTDRTGREASVTFCQKPNATICLFQTVQRVRLQELRPSDAIRRYGESTRIGDAHSHPRDADTIGILPSQADFYSTLVDTKVYKQRQISCVTSPTTPLMECYIPRETPDNHQLYQYEKALDEAMVGVPSVLHGQCAERFEIGLFNPDNGERINKPHAKDIVKSALGESTKDLRKQVTDLERPGFCEYIAAFTRPTKDVTEECKASLRRETYLV